MVVDALRQSAFLGGYLSSHLTHWDSLGILKNVLDFFALPTDSLQCSDRVYRYSSIFLRLNTFFFLKCCGWKGCIEIFSELICKFE